MFVSLDENFDLPEGYHRAIKIRKADHVLIDVIEDLYDSEVYHLYAFNPNTNNKASTKFYYIEEQGSFYNKFKMGLCLERLAKNVE
jgi:hypothetical protein